jgi:4'-phosphopantetheinyl transferase EntD
LADESGGKFDAKPQIDTAQFDNPMIVPGPRKPENAAMPKLASEIGQVEYALRGWFPSDAFVKVARIDEYAMLPEEQAMVARAVDRRRREFATGRWLSREGLRHFGLPDQPILIGRLRNPLWPESLIGTISHDGDLCAVALRRDASVPAAGIGIDLVALSRSRADRMDELASMFVADPGELDSIATLNVPVDPELLLFSLKESVIKAMASRLDNFIDMRAIEIRHVNKFEVHMLGTVIPVDLFGEVAAGYLVTAASVR